MEGNVSLSSLSLSFAFAEKSALVMEVDWEPGGGVFAFTLDRRAPRISAPKPPLWICSGAGTHLPTYFLKHWYNKQWISSRIYLQVKQHVNQFCNLLFFKNNLFYFFLIFLFIYLAVPGLSYGMWDLVPWPGIKPRPYALGAWSLSHWTSKEVPVILYWHDLVPALSFAPELSNLLLPWV